MIFLVKKEPEEILISDFRKEQHCYYTGFTSEDEYLIHAHEVDYLLGTMVGGLDTHCFDCMRFQYEFYHYS